MGTVWQWVVGITLALIISLGGHIVKNIEVEADAARTEAARLDVEIAQQKVRSDIEYREIQRQLKELKDGQDRIEGLLRGRRF